MTPSQKFKLWKDGVIAKRRDLEYPEAGKRATRFVDKYRAAVSELETILSPEGLDLGLLVPQVPCEALTSTVEPCVECVDRYACKLPQRNTRDRRSAGRLRP